MFAGDSIAFVIDKKQGRGTRYDFLATISSDDGMDGPGKLGCFFNGFDKHVAGFKDRKDTCCRKNLVIGHLHGQSVINKSFG